VKRLLLPALRSEYLLMQSENNHFECLVALAASQTPAKPAASAEDAVREYNEFRDSKQGTIIFEKTRGIVVPPRAKKL
jgi:hypothetical protein